MGEGKGVSSEMLKEVYALARLCDTPALNLASIVRYYGAWVENNTLYVQMEVRRNESRRTSQYLSCEAATRELLVSNSSLRSSQLCDGTLTKLIYGDARIFDSNEAEKVKLLRSMVQALEVVHGNGLVHLDIKPENIFARAGQYKLGDFGLCRNGKGERHVEEGDQRYMSMEVS